MAWTRLTDAMGWQLPRCLIDKVLARSTVYMDTPAIMLYQPYFDYEYRALAIATFYGV